MDITSEQLEDIIADLGNELQAILDKTLPCHRMSTYLNGTRKERLDLSHNVPMGHFSDEQHEFILRELTEMMLENDNESTEIVLKVLFPETLIRIFKRLTNKSYNKAEEELFKGKVRYEIIKGISCFF